MMVFNLEFFKSRVSVKLEIFVLYDDFKTRVLGNLEFCEISSFVGYMTDLSEKREDEFGATPERLLKLFENI